MRPRILTMPGFEDLKSISRDKMADVEGMTEGSPIEPEIKEALLPLGQD